MSELNQIAEAHSKYLTDPSDRNLPEGFQVTEAGLIPECWEYKLIGEIASVFSGGTPNRKIAEYWDGDIPWVTTTLIDGAAINAANEYITRKGVESSSAKWCKAGTILMAMYGQGKTRGKVGVLGIDATINQACAAIELKDSSSTTFVLQVLNSMYEDIRDLSNSGGQENLSSGIIKNIGIPYPPAEERSAIANALSDVDALINSLEKLIAKKQAIKTATMQQLLTGKTRLPQFATHPDGTPKGYKQSELGEIPEDWEVVTLERATICLDNLRVPLNENQRSKMKGDIPYCGANGIVGWVSDHVVDDDIILMAEDGGYFDEYATRPIAYRMIGKCWVNNHAHILQAKDGFDQGYVFYSLVHKDIQKYLASGTRAKLNKSEMEKIEIVSPVNKYEQAVVASALTAMDDEIKALEGRLTKTRQLKQGMMQELLTGKTRLVKPAESAA